MHTLRPIFLLILLPLLASCAGNQPGRDPAPPVAGEPISLTVVNDADGPVDVFYYWESRTPRARLGTVAVGRSGEFKVPWVTGRLLVLFESPVMSTPATSNALPLSESERPEALTVRIDWRYRAILEVVK
jgi:hypothetical protein